MGVPKLKTKISAKEYLEGELVSQTRHEFVSGEVYAMAGTSERHHRICLNLAAKVDAHLDGSDCDVFITEIKLKVSEETFYYPDIFVACDKKPKSEYFREHPILIIEVSSPSTRQIDRREKLRAYQQMEDVLEYVVIEQDKMHIELHRRQPDGNWITYFYNDNDLDVDIEFQSIKLKTKIEEIYRRVKF
jgi:Uma2 family endonuclease